MKNNIKQAVLFTIRDIENREYFKGVCPEPSQALIDYFISLSDDFTSWLNEHAQKRDVIKTTEEPSIDKYKSLSENIQKNADEFEDAYEKAYGNKVCSEEHSLIESISNAQDLGELQFIKASFLLAYEDFSEEEQSRWEPIHSFICKIPDAESSEIESQQNSNVFSIEDYNKLALTSLKSNVTHCDKENPQVQHRLGWYHKEDDDNGGTAACAVYPWSEEMETDHNHRWANALISTLKEEYPSIERILLVCHDRDFSGFSGKDEVVTEGLFINELKKSFPQLGWLIVFQHSNSTITGALNKKKASDVYTTIEEYAKGYYTIKKADEDNENANAHDNCCKDKTTEDGGEPK